MTYFSILPIIYEFPNPWFELTGPPFLIQNIHVPNDYKVEDHEILTCGM